MLAAEGDGLAAIRRSLRYSAAEIERACGLTRGVLSAVERGRLYPYPRLRAVVTSFLSSETGEPFEELHERLFPDYELPPIEHLERSES